MKATIFELQILHRCPSFIGYFPGWVLGACVEQRCPILPLEGHRLAKFSFNLPQYTCLYVSCNPEELD